MAIRLDRFAKELELELLEDAGQTELELTTADLNRPGLQMAGYYNYFASNRVQVFGKVEMEYLSAKSQAERQRIFEKFFGYRIPCAIISKDLEPFPEMREQAKKNGRVILRSNKYLTSKLEHVLINYLWKELAPSITRHGVLMDIYGVGVLIIGESGIGKSEIALELVRRGHRLVADDAVQIKKVSDERLVGESPEILRHFMEIRGVGIVNVETMYGISSVIKQKSVDMIIRLEVWKEDKNYDRFGNEEEFESILDIELPRLVLPVRPGRNLAIIMEVAARNFRLKAMGYNAFDELLERRRSILGG